MRFLLTVLLAGYSAYKLLLPSTPIVPSDSFWDAGSRAFWAAILVINVLVAIQEGVVCALKEIRNEEKAVKAERNAFLLREDS